MKGTLFVFPKSNSMTIFLETSNSHQMNPLPISKPPMVLTNLLLSVDMNVDGIKPTKSLTGHRTP